MPTKHSEKYEGLIWRGASEESRGGWSFFEDPATKLRRITIKASIHQYDEDKAGKWMQRYMGRIDSAGPRLEQTFLQYATEIIGTKETPGRHSISAETREDYVGHILGPWVTPLHRLLVIEITPRHIRQLVLQPMKDAGRARKTIKLTLSILRTIFGWAECEDEFIDSNPVTKISKRELPKSDTRKKRTYGKTDLDYILSQVSEKYVGVFAMAIFTGARMSEILGLRWMDVDFDNREIIFRGQRRQNRTEWTPGLKNGDAEKKVRMPLLLIPYLKSQLSYVGINRRPENFCFPDVHHGTLGIYIRGQKDTPKRKGYKGLRDRLGPPWDGSDGKAPFTLHKFRHNLASELMAAIDPNNKDDLAHVASQIGDSPQTVLGTYTHVVERERDNLVDRIYGG